MIKMNDGLVYFGAAGAGAAYSEHSGQLPSYFLDNDDAKDGHFLHGRPIKHPKKLTIDDINSIKKIVITSGYLKEILPQLESLGIPSHKISIPPKSYLGRHPFKNAEVRVKSAGFLSNLMMGHAQFTMIAGGGTALGICRDSDFIHWDFDFDLFAEKKSRDEIFLVLEKLDCQPYFENQSIKACFHADDNTAIPFSVDFFDGDKKNFIDKYEDHEWIWPIAMFNKPEIKKVHGFSLYVPSSYQRYLAGVYGANWHEPRPDFSYFDYGGGASSL